MPRNHGSRMIYVLSAGPALRDGCHSTRREVLCNNPTTSRVRELRLSWIPSLVPPPLPSPPGLPTETPKRWLIERAGQVLIQPSYPIEDPTLLSSTPSCLLHPFRSPLSLQAPPPHLPSPDPLSIPQRAPCLLIVSSRSTYTAVRAREKNSISVCSAAQKKVTLLCYQKNGLVMVLETSDRRADGMATAGTACRCPVNWS